MNCQHYKEVLLEIARGQDPANAGDAISHAASCRECSDFLNQQRNLTNALLELKSTAVPQIDKLPSVLIHEVRSRKTRSKLWIRTARAAVLAAMLIGGWYWIQFVVDRSAPSEDSSIIQPIVESREPEFIPLYYGEPVSEHYHLVRVVLPGTALQQFGLPFDPSLESEVFEADVLLSENGLPQAIRFIRER